MSGQMFLSGGSIVLISLGVWAILSRRASGVGLGLFLIGSGAMGVATLITI